MEQQAVPRILIIDDVETNRFVLKEIISQMGYQPILTENGEQALRIVERFSLSLVISDIAMPVMDGYEFCRIMKENANTREIPIIFISAFDDPSDVVKGFEIGGADYITKPFIPEVVRARVKMHVRLAEGAQELQELNRKLRVSVTEQMRLVEREKRNVLYAVSRIARENASYDELHMERLCKNSRILAEAMQLSPSYDSVISDSYIDMIEFAAPLCDIGNVAIPTDILQKKDSLTPEEWQVIKTHTTVGAHILEDIEENSDYNSFIHMSKDIANYHHENWDGTGYPEGRRGEEIPLSAQIVSTASAYSALTEARAYREAFSKEEALEIMKQDVGKKYNPEIFDILSRISKRLN